MSNFDFGHVINMAMEPFDEIIRLRNENAALKEKAKSALEMLRGMDIGHDYCEDSWYSCPKAEDGCADESKGDDCNCGADNYNAKLHEVISLLDWADE